VSARTIGVTGATGFVGGVVAEAFAAAGHRVVAFGRRPAPPYEHRAYSLATPVDERALADVDAVVHCAYDLTLTDPRAIERVNVGGTDALVRAAQRAQTRVVLVSSMSAYPGTTQIYGQAKLRSERIVLGAGGEAVRLGLVWGAGEAGMIGTLRRLARLPVVPMFGRDLHQFTVHAADVGAAFVELAGLERVGEPLGLAHPEPVPFEQIVRHLSDRRPPAFVRVPWRPVYATLRAAELLRLPMPVRADSLLGLVRAAPRVENAGFWPAHGVELTPFGAAPAPR